MSCDTPVFSVDEIDNMTSKVGTLASAVMGTAAGADGLGGGAGGGGFLDMFTCSIGTECYKTKHNKYLKRKYDEKKQILNDIPVDLSRAEKNYYVYNKGEYGGNEIYNRLIIDRFAKTAQQFKQNSIEKQQEFMSNLAQYLKQYQSEVIFQGQTAKLLKTRQDEQTALTKNVNLYKKIIETSERKVVYENRNMDSLYLYRRMMFFVYYTCIICFILFGNFIPDKLYKNYSVWLIVVIASVFPLVLNILIKWLFIIVDTVSYWFAELPNKDVYWDMQ